MKKSRFTEEQMAYALRQADTGTRVSINRSTFYNWKKKYVEGLG
jgi:putative transposase